MHLWIAVKYSPLSLHRDIDTHINWGRLDGHWWLPKVFDYSYPLHTEALITHACGRGQCIFCARFGPQTRVGGVHYISYSVDRKHGVLRTLDRHEDPPLVEPCNDEHWYYFQTPIIASKVESAFKFLELQVNKPLRLLFMFNFLCLCRRDGSRKGDDFTKVSSWHCTELVCATLLQAWPEYEEHCIQDPCLVSPCILDLQLRELIPKEPVATVRVLPVLAL